MVGREEQLKQLTDFFNSDRNNLTVLYGRHGSGKTTLINRFTEGKKAAYFNALPSVDFELFNNFKYCICNQYPGIYDSADYEAVFRQLVKNDVRIIVIENFQNIVKADSSFMADVAHFVKNSETKVMFVFSCPSVQWIENTMVRSVGAAALMINAFIKLKQLNYASVVNLFPDMDARTCLYACAVTGGYAGYLKLWNDKLDIKDNICNLLLEKTGALNNEAANFVGEEFRETSVYNTILACLAAGKNKLNEIHEYTGFGRDKISVYLNNLIEREIVEKIFSFDAGNNRNSRKGLYRIQDGFVYFWYKFIYPNYGILECVSPSDFYDRYISEYLDEFALESLIDVSYEFFEIMSKMGRLSFPAEYKGRWYGKTGDIHIVYSGKEGNIIGQCHTGNRAFDMADYEKLSSNYSNAGVNPKQVYLFSTTGFTDEFMTKHDTMITPIRIEDL